MKIKSVIFLNIFILLFLTISCRPMETPVIPTPDVLHLTAIYYDGKTHISWNNPNGTSGVEIFSDSEKIECDVKTAASSVYGNYSYCILKNSLPGKSYIVKTKTKQEQFSVEAVETGLPVVIIETENCVDVADKVNKIPAKLNILNSGNLKNPDLNANITIKCRGNSSFGMPKKSYTIKLEKKSKVLGMENHKTWALIANYADKTLLHNSIAYEMGRNIFTNMEWCPSTKNVQVFLNGEYIGLYMLTESIKIDKNRVNIPNIEDCNDISTASNFGFLQEVNARADENFNFTTKQGLIFSLQDPDGADISTDLQQVIQETTQRAEDALYSEDFDDDTSANHFGNFFDIDSFIDWWIVNEVAKNNDAVFFLSCYMYFNPTDQKIHMGPLWDFDIGFGNINYNGNENPQNFYNKNAGYLARMFEDKKFTTKAKGRWNEKYSELSTYFSSDVKNQFAELSIDAKANFSRWQILGTYVWPNAPGYENRTTYKSECDYFSDWASSRLQWLNTAINEL